jgi:hypothetical protein
VDRHHQASQDVAALRRSNRGCTIWHLHPATVLALTKKSHRQPEPGHFADGLIWPKVFSRKRKAPIASYKGKIAYPLISTDHLRNKIVPIVIMLLLFLRVLKHIKPAPATWKELLL